MLMKQSGPQRDGLGNSISMATDICLEPKISLCLFLKRKLNCIVLEFILKKFITCATVAANGKLSYGATSQCGTQTALNNILFLGEL